MVDRSVLEQAFLEGGSVLYRGQIITHPDGLPTEMELAEGDKDRQSAVLAKMEADLAARHAELDAIKAQMNQAPKPAPAVSLPAPTVPTEGEGEEQPKTPEDLRARLESLTIAELKAEAEEAGITIPSSAERKADIVDFLLSQVKE